MTPEHRAKLMAIFQGPMTPERAFSGYKIELTRQITIAIEDIDEDTKKDPWAFAARLVELAEINGMFDPVKSICAQNCAAKE